MMGNQAVRPAALADADGIAAVHVQAWRETYGHLVSDALLAGLDEGEFAARWKQTIEDDATDVWVAVDEQRVVGWASASSRQDTERPHLLELDGLYVLAHFHGTGAGQALLEAAVGEQNAYLWVADGNSRALAFYQRNGFAPDGARDTKTLVGSSVDVVRLTRTA